MAGYTRYDDLAVGDVFPDQPLAYTVTTEAVEAFLGATGDTSPAYGANNAPRQAPSMLAAVFLVHLLKARNSPPGGIHAKQSIRFFRKLAVGETLTLQGEVVEKYLRKERPYVVADFEARDTRGAMVANGRITTIWGRDA